MTDRKLAAATAGRAAWSRSALTKGARALLAGAIVGALAFAGGAPAMAADGGVGGGGVGGGGGGGQIAGEYWLYTGDYLTADYEPQQGWGQDSIDYFASAMEQEAGWANGVGGNRSGINNACGTAISDAIARSNGASSQARVVQVGVSVDSQNGGWWMGWGGDQGAMRSWYQGLTDQNYWQPNMPGYSAEKLAQVHDAFQNNVTPTPRIVCVALNSTEGATYDLSLSTAKSTVFTTAGATAGVSDTIRASTSSGIRENVTAKVTLNWGGVEGNGKSVSKNVTIANSGNTNSPTFTPGDFGWASWPSGKFWFDVSVAKQGQMNAAASHAGANDSAENWTVARTSPTKIITSGPGRDAMASDEVLASGMSYNAEITARTNGYTSAMTITDTVNTDKVWIGSDSKDVASAAYVEDPKGNKVSGATISIDRSTAGKVGVSGTVKNIPAGNQALEYTLVVPTYVLPTKSDYTIADTSKVCYTAAEDECISGNGKTTHKVTPAPDKVWVIDQNGALAAADPSKTNQQGVDQKVFAPGADIGAVVNGEIPAKLAENLDSYTLTDDWTGAAKYVDFSDASKARVFYDGVDVTRQFTIKVQGTTTVATANAAFLGATKGLDAAKGTKLYIAGQFRKDYDTAGKLQTLTNSGSEQVNNEAVATNTPAIFTVTPTPDKAWVLDENGGLTTVDSDKSNAVGADGKIFLQGDAVSAVVNGKIPANLGSAMKSYAISDDWTKAAKYVDFSDVSKAKVYLGGKDVTSGFSVNVVGTKTTAVAGAAFLAGTKGLAKDATVKLIISGQFREDFDTNGKVVQLTNSGSESWNGKEVATNSPPVFTWTPDPNKQVLGSSEESGDKAHADINGSAVWPGQKLEYSVGIDLRVPTGTARGVKTLAVEDQYDAHFTPDKASIEFWDSRDASNPKPIARSNYKIAFDEDNHRFTATFTQAWLDTNVSNSGANSEWLTQGWLTMRLTGTVDKSTPAGSTVVNQAFQVINGARTASDVPVVTVPAVTPDKESLSTDQVDIDGKTVVTGDTILYRLTLDGGPARDKLAYNVHKLGIVDDYDDAYLDVDADAITVTDKASGKDVTGQFNVQVKDGVAYVFAKTIDTESVYGGTIAGDPQASDLKAFDQAPIRPLEDPIIDQSLLGKKYWVTMPATVTKADAGHVIENTATQNIQNSYATTKVVSNPLAAIDPTKDVVVDEASKDASLQGTEVRMNTSFNYRLNSSEIPANRAYSATQWSLSDAFNQEHDLFTGIWAVYANTDIYDGETLLFKKGDLLQDSTGDAAEDSAGLFDVTFDEEAYTLHVQATEKYLELVGKRADLENAFSVYTKMVRVAPGEDIQNTITESYNRFERTSNGVTTFTKEYPGIAVQKYTLAEGTEKGVHGDKDSAYVMTKDELGSTTLKADTADGEAGTKLQNGVEVGIHFANTGDVPLTDVTVTDTTFDGLHGELQGLVCAVPADPTAPAAIQGTDPVTPDADGMVWVQPATITELALAGGVDCRGTVREMTPGMTHGDTVVVTGKSIFSDTTVKDEDSWFAVAPSTPGIKITQYTLSEGSTKGQRPLAAQALVLDAGQAKYGTQVGFDVTNTGDEALSAVAFKNATIKGTTGAVSGVKWLDPVEADPAPTPSATPTPTASATPTATPTASATAEAKQAAAKSTTTVTIGKTTYTERPVSEVKELAVGQTVLLVGTLKDVKEGTLHTDGADVTAAGAYSGMPVNDDDPWNAKRPKAPVAPAPPKAPIVPEPPKAGAVTGEGIQPRDDRQGLLGSSALLLLAAAVTAYVIRRRNRAGA